MVGNYVGNDALETPITMLLSHEVGCDLHNMTYSSERKEYSIKINIKLIDTKDTKALHKKRAELYFNSYNKYICTYIYIYILYN